MPNSHSSRPIVASSQGPNPSSRLGRRVQGSLVDSDDSENMEGAKKLRESGDLKGAQDQLQKIIKSRVSDLGKNHPDTLASKTLLALTLKDAGNLRQAEKMQWDIFKAIASSSGMDHPDTLASADALVETMKARENFRGAERLQRRVMVDVVKAVGNDHSQSLALKNNLSVTLRQSGKDLDAEELQEEILSSCQPWLQVREDSPFARHRRIPVFGYGSNNMMQICERVEDPDVPSSKGYLPDYKRVFVGYSQRWQGAPASVERQPFCAGVGCRGTLAWLTDAEVRMLDRYEGCRSAFFSSRDPRVNVYRREKVQIKAWVAPEDGTSEVASDGKRPIQLDAWVYIKNDRNYGMPSREYLEAVVKNIREYWEEDLAEELSDFIE